jgi:hypothetical protein
MVLDGVVLAPATARLLLQKRCGHSSKPHLVCHAGYLVGRLSLVAQVPQPVVRAAREQAHLDICELFAFAAPAVMAVPTPSGLAWALGLTPGPMMTATVEAVARELLQSLGDRKLPEQPRGASGRKLP